MSADFSDPAWAYVWVAHGAAGACLIVLMVVAWSRLSKWRRAARALDNEPSTAP